MKKIMFIVIVILSAFALFAQTGALINQATSEASSELMEQIAKTNAQTRNFSFNFDASPYNLPDATDIADPGTGTFLEDVAWIKDFSRHINNPDNLALTLSFLVPSTRFTVTQPDPGDPFKLQLQPIVENWNGFELLVLVASDGASGTDAMAVIRINVTPVPDEPIWSGLPDGNMFYTDEETALQLEFQNYVSCVDSADPTNFNLSVLDADYPIVVTQAPPVTGSLVTFTPQQDYFGIATYELTAVDRLSNGFSSITIYINVLNVNDAPVISVWQPEELTQPTDQGESLAFSVTAEDVEDDPLTYTWTHSGSQDGTPFSNVVSTTASLELQFDIPGTQTISCEVSDGEATDSIVWTVIVRPFGPLFAPPGGTYTSGIEVALAPPAGFAGAEIFYTTDGTTPTEESAVYTAPIAVDALTDVENNVTIQAIFSYPGFPLSQVESQTYRITGTVAEPAFTPLGGLYYLPVEVALDSSNSEATIYYTIDGSDPEPENPGTEEYELPITVPAETTLTIRALAMRAGWLDSEIVSQTYQVTGSVQILAHTLTPPPLPEGEFYLIDQGETLAVEIAELSVTPAGATVYYTLDNSLPDPDNPNALVYTNGQQIQVANPTWITFKAYLEDWQTSETYSYYYDVRTKTVFLPYANGTVFDPEPGYSSTPILVSISGSTNPAEADVYYTLDGSEPDPDTALLYTEPLEISETTEIKTLAQYPGLYPSNVHTAVFTITGTVAAPVFDPLPGSFPAPIELTMSSSTAGAAIYYSLDGSEPSQDTRASFLYEGPVALGNGLHQVRARAFKQYWDPSSITEGTYITGLLPTPEFDLEEGIYFDPIVVHLSVPSVPAASIYYTTDGTEPSEDSTLYNHANGIPIGLETNYTIKAISVQTGWINSEIAQRSYQVTGTVATPVFSPDGGSHSGSVTVSITSSTPDAVIRYTLDGEEPSLDYGYSYYEPILISSSATLKARAYRSDWRPSGIYGAIYTIIGNIANPVFIPGPGYYTAPTNVYILVGPPDASIYYTSDGTEPSSDNGTAYVSGTPINVSTDVLLRARAYKTGWNASGITDAQYYITGTLSDPVFNPPAGLYEGAQAVTLSAIPATATIYYTSDGSEPNPGNGTEYVSGAPINVLSHVLLRARAYKTGWNPSGITDAQYYITGIGEHVPPAAVEGVQVNVIGNDAFISWLPVTQTIYGTPLTPDLYIVLYNETPYEDDNYYYYLTSTENLSTIHTRVALFRDAMFYRVVAVKFYREGESDVLATLNSSREEILWSELKTRLANVRDKQ